MSKFTELTKSMSVTEKEKIIYFYKRVPVITLVVAGVILSSVIFISSSKDDSKNFDKINFQISNINESISKLSNKIQIGMNFEEKVRKEDKKFLAKIIRDNEVVTFDDSQILKILNKMEQNDKSSQDKLKKQLNYLRIDVSELSERQLNSEKNYKETQEIETDNVLVKRIVEPKKINKINKIKVNHANGSLVLRGISPNGALLDNNGEYIVVNLGDNTPFGTVQEISSNSVEIGNKIYNLK